MSTLSTTWMTPLDAITSVFVTCVDPFRKTFPPRTETFTEGPASVSTCLPFRGGDGGRGEVALHDVIEQDRLEQGRVAPDLLERGVRQLRGRAFVGAKTVNAPGLLRVPARPAFSRSGTSVRIAAPTPQSA